MPEPTNPDPATTATPTPGETGTDTPDGQTTDPAATATPANPADGAPTAETKPDGDGKPGETKSDAKPIEYGEFAAAEGVTLDQDAVGEFKALASDAKLTQEQAQKVVDIGVKLQQKWAAQQTQAMETARTQWAEASNTDKEFGGEKLAENLAVAKAALDKFGSPELKQLLNDSGLGNHPEVIRFFYRAGRAISDDRLIGGGNGPGPATDPATVLFPSMK